jgi:hypothetical protein
MNMPPTRAKRANNLLIRISFAMGVEDAIKPGMAELVDYTKVLLTAAGHLRTQVRR